MKRFRSDESGVTPKFLTKLGVTLGVTPIVVAKPLRRKGFIDLLHLLHLLHQKIYCFRKTCNLHEIHVTCETFSKTQVVFRIRCNALKKAAGPYCRKGFQRYA